MEQVQPGIFKKGDKLYTKAASTESVYGESFVTENGIKYRNWQPSRSKVGAAVMKDIDLGMGKDSKVLYLGAASGTTVSHFSDILEGGFVFAVEYSDTVIRDLVDVAESRENIAPILGNARNPKEYSDIVGEVDIVFQDISQKDQPEIFIKNCEKYLKEGGIGLFAVKAQSISSSKNKGEVFEEVREKISDSFEILDQTELEPYERQHLFLKLRKN